MARPREFDADKALKDIQKTFWENGYHGTSLQDIEAATGLKKQSLYREFGNKDGMYARALALYVSQDVAQLATALEGQGDPRARFRRFFNLVLAGPRRGDRAGCFLCNSAIDHAHEDTATAQTARNGIDGTVTLFERVLAATSPHDTDPVKRRNTALAMTSGYLGLRLMIRAGTPLVTLEQVAETLIDMV